MATKAWYEIGADLATMAGFVGILFLFAQYYFNKDVRNLQLMHRCIDNFREWANKDKPVIDFTYLELLNEELFYLQKGLIEKEIALEWIEGIIDYIQIQGRAGVVLNSYNKQTDVESLSVWETRQLYFARIKHFVHPKLPRNFESLDINNTMHARRKRELAKMLYKHIKDYKY